MTITNIKSIAALALTNTYQIKCDIQYDDGTISKDMFWIITEEQLKEYIARKRKS